MKTTRGVMLLLTVEGEGEHDANERLLDALAELESELQWADDEEVSLSIVTKLAGDARIEEVVPVEDYVREQELAQMAGETP